MLSMHSNPSLPWWKRILVDEQFRKQLTFIATEIYRQEQIVLEKYPERITHDENTNKERKECELSCLSSSSSPIKHKEGKKEYKLQKEQEELTKCTSQFLFLRSTDNVATHHPQSIIHTSSYKTQHSMLLPTITQQQNNNDHYSNVFNTEEQMDSSNYNNESNCNNNNNNNNTSAVVSNYLHRIRRYSTETSERCKKCDARDIIHNKLEYQEARDALNANTNNNNNCNALKYSRGVHYFPSIEGVEENIMWARATQNTPYAKLFAIKSARNQVDERKKQYMESHFRLHNSISNSCNRNSNNKNNDENNEVKYDEMHFRKLLARSCVDGANNLYGLSYYWSTSYSSHQKQYTPFVSNNTTTTINSLNRCNLPPAGFIRVNPDPREAMWPSNDEGTTSSINNEPNNEEVEKMCSTFNSVHNSHGAPHKKNWERLKEYVNKRNAKLAMLRAHGCEITMNMLHDNTYTLQDKALEQWINEIKQHETTINTTENSSESDIVEKLMSKKTCIKPLRHGPLFVNFMKPLEHYHNQNKNGRNDNNNNSKRRKWECVGTFRQSQLLILYKIYCVALHKYSTIQKKKKEQRINHQYYEEEYYEEEEVDLSDVPLLQETQSVYKVSWSNAKTIEQKQVLSSQNQKEWCHSRYLLGLISCCCPTHVQQHSNTNHAEYEMKWQWWWDYLHNSSLLARQALRDIYNCLPLNSERELGADGYMAFVESLLNLFFPTYVGNTELYNKIAHEEWVYRGTAEVLMPFNTFFEKFFTFPFIFMRDIVATTEQDYVEFWTLVRICLYGDNTKYHNTYFFTHLPYVTSVHDINEKKSSLPQLQTKKDKIASKVEIDGLDWSARFTKSNSNKTMEPETEKEEEKEENNKSMWKLTRPSLLGADFSKRRLSLLVPLQDFTLNQLRYLNTYPYEHLARHNNNTNEQKIKNSNWKTHKNENKKMLGEEEEVINDITTLQSSKTHLYDDPLAASFIRSKLFTLQSKDRFNRTLSSTIMNSERFITDERSGSNTNKAIDTSMKMICDVDHVGVKQDRTWLSNENDKFVQERLKETEMECKVHEEKIENNNTSTHSPLIEHVPHSSTSSSHHLLRQHRSIRIATAGNSRRRMLREAETRIKLKNLLNHSYMYARRRVNLARKLHNKLSSLEATSSSWNLYKDDVYELPLRSESNSTKEYEEEEKLTVEADNKEKEKSVCEQSNEISYCNIHDDDDDDNIDELLDYLADVDDEMFDNKEVSLRDRFRIHKKYTKLTM